MKLKNSIVINAYTHTDNLAFSKVLSKNDWYEKPHPIIDSEKEREKLNVTKVLGEQYDDTGRLVTRWLLNYSQQGKLLEEWVWTKENGLQHTHF